MGISSQSPQPLPTQGVQNPEVTDGLSLAHRLHISRTSFPGLPDTPRLGSARGDVMSPMAAVENAFCETYEGLVCDCETARKEWKDRRREISELGLRGKGVDHELRRLQAGFAKSYAMVRNHLRGCDSCQSARGTDQPARPEVDGGVFPEFRVSFFPDAHTPGV
jgi:hypothetical protein